MLALPAVEFNWIYHATQVDVDLPTRHGFIDFGDFESTGNLVTLAAGANAVLIPSKLEFGAVYTTAIVTQERNHQCSPQSCGSLSASGY